MKDKYKENPDMNLVTRNANSAQEDKQGSGQINWQKMKKDKGKGLKMASIVWDVVRSNT